MKLSIVTSVYNSAETLERFHNTLIGCAENFAKTSFEIIYVNDGSNDKSFEIGKNIVLNSSPTHNIQLVDLSRNFGQHKALMTGLNIAKGEKIFMLDSDMEENPSWLFPLHKKLLETNADVVFGVQEKRRGDFFDRISGAAFYKLFNFLSKEKIEENLVTARLMTNRYVNEVFRHRETELYLPGIFEITGFQQEKIIVKKAYLKNSTYSLSKKFSLAINSITSFSNAPLIMSFYVGAMIVIVAIIFIIKIFIDKFLLDTTLTGWSSLIISIWFIGGLNIFFIGLVGIYISKMFMEVKQRPYSIIREIIKKDSK